MIYTDINTFPLHDAIPIDPDGVLIDTCGLDRIISFDPESGLLRCEAGILFSEILALAVPKGWFLPVTPGTRFVTLGGAIANRSAEHTFELQSLMSTSYAVFCFKKK